jgi:hypothetical protein
MDTFWHLRDFLWRNWSRLNIYKNIFERSILDLAIPIESLVPIQSAIWLTAVKHMPPAFFQKNKDPRTKMGNFWDFDKICQIVQILGFKSCFFISAPEARNCFECDEKGRFSDAVIQGFFSWKWYESHFRNIKSSLDLEYGLGSIFSNFGLIGC